MQIDKTEMKITEDKPGGQSVCSHREHRVTKLIGNKGWKTWEQRLMGLIM